MGSLNHVQLIGFLGGDPEVKYTQSGTAVANLSLATTERWTSKEGEKQEKTEWHRLVAWRKTAEVMGEYLRKGSMIYVQGRLETRKWQDQSGQDRYTTEIVVDRFQFLDRRQDSDGGNGNGGRPAHIPPPVMPDGSTPPGEEDDLPF